MPNKPAAQSASPKPARPRAPRKAKSNDNGAIANDAASQIGSSPVAALPPSEPSYDKIAEAAYHRFLQRGGTDGHDFNDWLEAERELKQRRR